MGEGALGGLLGGEEDSPEIEGADASLLMADAFAAAISANQSSADPAVAQATRIFLDEQARLVRTQRLHLEEEHPLRLKHLYGQSTEGTLRRIGQRIRIGLQVFTALVATAIGGGLLVMIYDAFQSRSVVVESFDVSPALAMRGPTGKLVAQSVLDALEKLREATRSESKGLNVESAWSSDVKIEVPETGLSIGEIGRLLRERFGHDVHIGGDLVPSAEDGLALTVRGEAILPRTFTGGAGDLDKLTIQAADYVYGRSQPYQFARYLISSRRYDDALAFFPEAFARAANDEQRADFANEWGNAFEGLNKPAQAVEKYRLAMTLKPHFWRAWGNFVNDLSLSESEEAAWQGSRVLLQAGESAPKKDRPALHDLFAPARMTLDIPLALASWLAQATFSGGSGAATVNIQPVLADFYMQVHDPVEAMHHMAASDQEDPFAKAETLLLQGYTALDHDDAPAALAPLREYWAAWQANSFFQPLYFDHPCLAGLVLGLTGHRGESEDLFKRMGPWSRCAAYHGDVLEHDGDLAGAERIWGENLRIAPDLPWVYLHRGVSELKRGDLKRAETDLLTASGKAPHWADPLKAWGDVLAGEGNWKEALAKYDEALKYAPAWTELQQARDAAPHRG